MAGKARASGDDGLLYVWNAGLADGFCRHALELARLGCRRRSGLEEWFYCGAGGIPRSCRPHQTGFSRAGATLPLFREKERGICPGGGWGVFLRTAGGFGRAFRFWQQRAPASGILDRGCGPSAHSRRGAFALPVKGVRRVAVAGGIGLGPGCTVYGKVPELRTSAARLPPGREVRDGAVECSFTTGSGSV